MTAEQTALGIDVVGPELVALLERLSISGEISAQGKRHTDRDRCARLGGLSSRGRTSRTGTASEQEGQSAGAGNHALTRDRFSIRQPVLISSGNFRRRQTDSHGRTTCRSCSAEPPRGYSLSAEGTHHRRRRLVRTAHPTNVCIVRILHTGVTACQDSWSPRWRDHPGDPTACGLEHRLPLGPDHGTDDEPGQAVAKTIATRYKRASRAEKGATYRSD